MNLKVSSKSDVNKVAGAISGIINEGKDIEITVIGAGALNQAIKAVTIARSYTIVKGIDLTISPSFVTINDITEEGEINGLLLKINKKEN